MYDMHQETDPLRVLVADDEPSIRFVLREALEAEGHEIVDVEDGNAASDALAGGDFDLAILDIRMPGRTGLEVLEQLRATGNQTAVVIITAQNTMDNAVEAMKAGALDYLVKPFTLAAVSALAEKAKSTRALQQEVRALRREVGRSAAPGGERLVGSSQSLLDIFKVVGKVAKRNVPVLITGESGTGKELVARAIHGASPRSEGHLEAAHARGYNRLDHILIDPSYGPMQSYPPFVDLKRRMADEWIDRLGASPEPTQVEARALAQAYIVLEDFPAALAVVEAAADRPGPIEEDLRSDAAMLRAELARRERLDRIRAGKASN